MIPLLWVPVGARLPDNDELVLVARDDGEVNPGFVARGAWFYSSGFPLDDAATHWMPFPPAPSARPLLRLGQICARLGFEVTEAFLGKLGFTPAARDGAARLYAESDYPLICAALARHTLITHGAQPCWGPA